MSSNPWVHSADRDAGRSQPQTAGILTCAAPALPALEPQPASVSAPRHALPRRAIDRGGPPVSIWWVGAHGGAGETTLEQLLEGSRAAGHAWPHGDDPIAPPPVLVVARTHARGLRAAQLAATEWAAGSVAVQLLGLVLVADAPGRLPKPLRDFSRIVAGAFPRVWHLPWVDAWRLGEPVSPETTPKAIGDVLQELRTSIAGPTPTPRR